MLAGSPVATQTISGFDGATATVEVDELSAEVLVELLDSDSWKGKAGAYDLAGMMGAHARLVSGDEVCVLGFALTAVEQLEAWLDSGGG